MLATGDYSWLVVLMGLVILVVNAGKLMVGTSGGRQVAGGLLSKWFGS